MNELLQKHGCSNVFTVPEGLRELMSDITREVLREQPLKICDFIANYLAALLITREHGVLAVKILDDLCDCRPSVSDHLIQLGVHKHEAHELSQIIKDEIEACDPAAGKEKVKETEIVKKILKRINFDEEMTAKVCQICRNAYRDYWYRKKLLEKRLKSEPEEAWEIAAAHTLEIYKKTKPSFCELNRAIQKIQAAYRGYHVRRNVLRHLRPPSKKQGPKVELPGPPLDTAASREIDLGPVLRLKAKEDAMDSMFKRHKEEKLGLKYDPTKTITHQQHFSTMYAQVEPSFPTAKSDKIASRKSSLKGPSMSAARSYREDMTPLYGGRASIITEPKSEPILATRTQAAELSMDEIYVQPEGHKISFAKKTKEIMYEGDSVLDNMIQELYTQQEADQITLEVPEDLPVDCSDGEGDSVVEEIAGEDTDAEEE